MKKEVVCSKLKNKCPSDDEIYRTKELFSNFNIKNGEELTRLFLKSDVISLADVFEKFNKVCTKEYGNNNLYFESLLGYTYQCALKYPELQTL